MKMMNGVKRARAAAFTDAERLTLRDIMLPFDSIIQNKRTDAATVLHKKEAWQAIQHCFNSCPNVTRRTGDQLRKAWENTKARDKRELAALHQRFPADCNTAATAGGDSDSLSAVNSTPLNGSNSPAFCLLGLADSDQDDSNLPRLNARLDCKSPCRATDGIHGAAQEHDLHSMHLRQARAVAEAAELRLELLREELSYEQERHELQLREARATTEVAEMRVELERRKMEQTA